MLASFLRRHSTAETLNLMCRSFNEKGGGEAHARYKNTSARLCAKIVGGGLCTRGGLFAVFAKVFSTNLGSMASFGDDTSEQSTKVFSHGYKVACSDNLPRVRTMDASYKSGSVD